MNYHDITHEDMNNGLGLRVVLWVSGCEIHCHNCQNLQTWDKNSGVFFEETAKQEIFEELSKPYIAGLTLSGGHPLEDYNVETIYQFLKEVKEKFPQKNIWLYTGYVWEYIFPEVVTDNFDVNRVYRQEIIRMCDVVVDGPYIEEQKDITLKWRGSRNQRVIDVQKTLSKQDKEIVLFCD